MQDPFNLAFGGDLGLSGSGAAGLHRAEGGPAQKGVIYETAEKGVAESLWW